MKWLLISALAGLALVFVGLITHFYLQPFVGGIIAFIGLAMVVIPFMVAWANMMDKMQ